MDPLSAAASIIAVLSLASGVVKHTKSIILFIDGLTDCPTELVRLRTLVAEISLICHTIVTIFERYRETSTPIQTIYECMQVALSGCQQALSRLNDALTRAHPRRGDHVSPWTSRVRLVAKRGHTKELEQQLLDAIEVLHLAVTTHM